jgi:hypothetical protein
LGEPERSKLNVRVMPPKRTEAPGGSSAGSTVILASSVVGLAPLLAEVVSVKVSPSVLAKRRTELSLLLAVT